MFDRYVLQLNIMLSHSDLTRSESAIAVLYKESQAIVFTRMRIYSSRGQSMLRVDMSSQPPLDLHIFSQLDKEMSFGLRFRLLLP